MCMNDGKTQYLSIAPKSAAALVDGNVIRVGVNFYNHSFAMCSKSRCLN